MRQSRSNGAAAPLVSPSVGAACHAVMCVSCSSSRRKTARTASLADPKVTRSHLDRNEVCEAGIETDRGADGHSLNAPIAGARFQREVGELICNNGDRMPSVKAEDGHGWLGTDEGTVDHRQLALGGRSSEVAGGLRETNIARPQIGSSSETVSG